MQAYVFERTAPYAHGSLGNSAVIRLYGWHHGLDHDTFHQRRLMVLRLERGEPHQLGLGRCFRYSGPIRLDVCLV